jgi:hypothetical protein
MEQKAERIREHLLSRLPQPENLEAYRQEVASMLEKNERALRRKKWGAVLLLVLMGGLATAFVSMAGQQLDTTKGPWLAILLACFFLLYGVAEAIKLVVNRAKIDLLKEVKQVQVHVLELHALIRKSGVPTSSQP